MPMMDGLVCFHVDKKTSLALINGNDCHIWVLFNQLNPWKQGIWASTMGIGRCIPKFTRLQPARDPRPKIGVRQFLRLAKVYCDFYTITSLLTDLTKVDWVSPVDEDKANLNRWCVLLLQAYLFGSLCANVLVLTPVTSVCDHVCTHDTSWIHCVLCTERHTLNKCPIKIQNLDEIPFFCLPSLPPHPHTPYENKAPLTFHKKSFPKCVMHCLFICA